MNIKRWIISTLIIVSVIAGLGFTKLNQIQAMIAFGESFPEPSASVQSTYAQNIDYTQTNKVIGQFNSPYIIDIVSEYPGPFIYVGFKPGDTVTKDQVLLRQDTRIEKAKLAAAKARVVLAESTFSRVNKLLQKKRISQDAFDKAQAELAVAKAEVENLNVVISKKTISAPFSGQVGLEQYQVGQVVDANIKITTLVGLNNTIWIDFAVPQTLKQPNIGQQVTVALVNQESTQRQAIIIAKMPMLNANSRQQNYRAELSNLDGALRHNQIASVKVPLYSRRAVIVPSNAVTRSHFGEFVYALEKDEANNWRAKPIQVILGEKLGDDQVVLSGLNGGEFIASEGAFKLKENILVYTEQLAAADNQVGSP
jgi:membrane fusion protein (multidrug efflux system)